MKDDIVPFVDLKLQYASIKQEVNAAIAGVLESCQFTLGKAVEEFERNFADYCGVKYAVAVNTGTSALHVALLSAGVGPGDEVITTPFTFVATVAAIHYAGAQPVLVDIDLDSYTIDVKKIERAVTSKTKAVIPVHLYGQSADMDPILDVARRHKLVVIEDAAQAHAATYKGRKVGGIGELGCFSFYPGKNLGAYGEGGMVTTNNPEYARLARMLRDWGSEKKYHHEIRGFNYRMEGVQGAVLNVKLRYLDQWTRLRQSHARLYDKMLAASSVITPKVADYSNHVYHLYVLRYKSRDVLQKALGERGIHTGLHYPVPVHLQPAYADSSSAAGQFPCAERAAKEVLSLPMFPELTESQIQKVAKAVLDLS